MAKKEWQTYEEVATYILNEMAKKFGLSHVEEKQKVTGRISGTSYEIDAKGILEDNTVFIVIECRRYTSSKIDQDQVAGLAYRIMDTGAEGGILVSPLGLQKGAEKIANAENIKHVELSETSTRENFLLRFLDELFLRVSDHVGITDSVKAVVNPRSDTENISSH